MIIYSIVPEETIFQGMEDEQAQAPTYELVRNGIIMQVRPINRTQAQIVKIVTPYAHHYLNPNYAPGTIIEMVPSFN